MKIYIKILSLFFCLGLTAQTTSIPDQNFEQHLIDEGIDSDQTINGQVLTSDIASVQTLSLNQVSDLTGLEDFIALESLLIEDGMSSWVWPPDITIDLTANINLIDIEILSFEGLKTLDVTGLNNLEDLRIMELQDDVITMYIEEIDLSTNPNIKYVTAGYLEFLKEVNLQNGNNINITNMEINISSYAVFPICLKVDDATGATNNNAPYNSWSTFGFIPNFYDQGVCTLVVDTLNKLEVALYPNPVQNTFQIKTSEKVDEVSLYSITGKEIVRFGSQPDYDISQLPTGMYFVKIQSNKGESIQRIIKR